MIFVCCVVAAFAQALAHYVLRAIDDARADDWLLPRLGIAGILIAFALYDLTLSHPHPNGMPTVALVCIVVASGAACIGCRALDRLIAMRNENAAHRAYREAAERRQREGKDDSQDAT